MMSDDLQAAIERRADAFGVKVASATLQGCATYLALLARWNRRMNLTALPLSEPVPDASVDKLVIEPLVAAPLLSERIVEWVDLGSGGGSPAIPLRVAQQSGTLRMVETRSRKCAFLREATRVVGLPRTTVVEGRYEDLPTEPPVDLITIRALRIDQVFVEVVSRLLAPEGRVLAFGGLSAPEPAGLGPLRVLARKPLPDGSDLVVLAR